MIMIKMAELLTIIIHWFTDSSLYWRLLYSPSTVTSKFQQSATVIRCPLRPIKTSQNWRSLLVCSLLRPLVKVTLKRGSTQLFLILRLQTTWMTQAGVYIVNEF